jgi:DNA-directed RNA polymerase specialized sigma24 family protein
VTVSQEREPEDLLYRMQQGDRAAAAEFMERFGDRVRRRIRGKLGNAMRRLFDSQEILSTLGRRLDVFIRSGQMRASTLPELWGLVFKLADNSLIEKARVFRSLQAREGEDGPVAQAMLRRLRAAESVGDDEPLLEIDRALQALPDQIDREILSQWLMGIDHVAIAESVGLAPTAVRKRWQKIRATLRKLCTTEAF